MSKNKNYLPAASCQLPVIKGFTLIEVLLVIAMIAILSAAILVSLSSQRDEARKSRVIVELSGVIQPMMMCWADGGTVTIPRDNEGGSICEINGSDEVGYGVWPNLDKSKWMYLQDELESSGDWYIKASCSDRYPLEYICCNSAYDRCADMGANSDCSATTALP